MLRSTKTALYTITAGLIIGFTAPAHAACTDVLKADACQKLLSHGVAAHGGKDGLLAKTKGQTLESFEYTKKDEFTCPNGKPGRRVDTKNAEGHKFTVWGCGKTAALPEAK